MIESIVGGIGVIIGVAIGYLLMKTGLKKQSTEIIESAKKEAEAIKKDKMFTDYDQVGTILFVNAHSEKVIE